MKIMKTRILSVVFAVCIFIIPSMASSAEITFDPGIQFYDMNSQGTLNLWGVPEANGNSIKANPDYGWPSEFTVAAWYAMILKAQEMGLAVVVGYDPMSLDIWYIASPR